LSKLGDLKGYQATVIYRVVCVGVSQSRQHFVFEVSNKRFPRLALKQTWFLGFRILLKIICLDDVRVDKVDDEGIDDRGAEFLDKVRNKRWVSVAQGV